LFSVLISLALEAQEITVKGTVTDNGGEPVAGASIQLKNSTTVYSLSDVDGAYSIKVPQNSTLVFACLGYKTQEKNIGSRALIDIVLEADSEMLNEVVVTGMTAMDKRLFTGAATKINGEDAKINGLADVSRSLEGRAAGVSVQNVSGTFGTAPKIRVRGATSIYGSSKPLWVVDGVIIEDVVEVSSDELSSGDANTLISSAIAGLNSDDIESFQILKDGSATSIYGARAMAGVIVVTTKKGTAGTSRISYTGEYSYRLKPSYENFNIMNSQEQMGVYQELQQKGYLLYSGTANAEASGVYGKMYQMISQYDATNGQFGLANTEEAMASYLRAAEYRNTDWFNLLFTNNIQHTHSVSISSGTEKVQTYASISLMNDEGWTLQSAVKRYTANFNTTYNISKSLSANLIANTSYRKQRAPGTLSSDTDPVSGEVKRDFDINPYSYAINTSRTLDPDEFYTRNYAPFNIFHELENNYMDLSVADVRIQGELTYKPIQKVTLKALGAMKYAGTSNEHYILDDSNQAQAYRAMPNSTIRQMNPLLYTDPDNIYALPISILPDGGIYERTDNRMLGWDFRGTASYNDEFAGNHIVNLFGGMESNSVDRHSTWFRGWGEQYNMGEIANYAYQAFKKGSEDNNQYYELSNRYERSVAFFATGTYSYKGRYTINGTGRYEGTNKLGKSRTSRWLPTWNVSAAWNVHEEDFMDNLSNAISHLSLKASYSLTADRGPAFVTNSYAVISSSNPWRPLSSLKESELYISSLANDELTYEKKRELNLGLATGFINNRINLEFDWYTRNNYDLIGICNTAGIGGEVTKYGNIAAMKSNGVELSLSTTNIKANNFTWTTSFIYSHTNNTVSQLKTTKRVIDLVSGSGFAMEGYPVRSIFSIPFKGLNDEGLPTFLDQNGNVTTTGIYFQEQNNLDFLEYSGSADPTDVGSFGNIFKWKGLTFNVFITYSFGNVVRLDPVFSNEYNDLDAMPKEFQNRWVVSGDENYTTIPVIASTRQNKNDSDLSYAYNAYNYSTERIAKGDFIRMKEISIAWQLPSAWVKKIGLADASLKLQGTNLFLLYADKKLNGQDPEFFNNGGVAVPVPKQFTLTLKLGL